MNPFPFSLPIPLSPWIPFEFYLPKIFHYLTFNYSNLLLSSIFKKDNNARENECRNDSWSVTSSGISLLRYLLLSALWGESVTGGARSHSSQIMFLLWACVQPALESHGAWCGDVTVTLGDSSLLRGSCHHQQRGGISLKVKNSGLTSPHLPLKSGGLL